MNLLRNIDPRDAAGIIGAIAIVAGLWMIYPPAAVIIAGVLLIVGAVLGARG